MPSQETPEKKEVLTKLLTVSVKYKDAFLPNCGVRFYGDAFDSGPINLTRDAFQIPLSTPIRKFHVVLQRAWTEPGDLPVIGADIQLADFEGPRELVIVVLDSSGRRD